MRCYCINCGQEQEMNVVAVRINNRAHEKKIKGYCQICSEHMCLIEILVPSEIPIDPEH